MNLAKLKLWWESLPIPQRFRQSTLVLAAALAGFVALYWDASSKSALKVDDAGHEIAENPDAVSTLIPAGYVLVPIEVANYESLDSILGKFGLVDLYVPSDDPKKTARKIASHLKILRAPLNPSHFAVLAKESESSRLVASNGPFIVVVQNPERAVGTQFGKTSEHPDMANDPTGESRQKTNHHSRITVEIQDDNKDS